MSLFRRSLTAINAQKEEIGRRASRSMDRRISTLRSPDTPIRSSRTNKTVYKKPAKTSEERVKDFVVPQPGDPNRLQKNLNNIKTYGMPSKAHQVKKSTDKNIKVKPQEKPKEPFKPETKKDVEKQMIALGQPTAKQAGFKLSTNTIIYGVIGIVVLVLLVNIKR